MTGIDRSRLSSSSTNCTELSSSTSARDAGASSTIEESIRRTAPFEHEIVSCARKEDLERDRRSRGSARASTSSSRSAATARCTRWRSGSSAASPRWASSRSARATASRGTSACRVDPALTLDACRGGRIVTIDTAEVNGQPFLGVMGIGFDAVVAERFASSNVRGLQTYVKEGLRAFAEFHAEEYEITCAGETRREKAFVIAIANSGQYGNNARIAPLASLQDGLLDVVIVDDLKLLAAPLLLARLFQRHAPSRGRRDDDAVHGGHASGAPPPAPRTSTASRSRCPRSCTCGSCRRSLRLLVPDARRRSDRRRVATVTASSSARRSAAAARSASPRIDRSACSDRPVPTTDLRSASARCASRRATSGNPAPRSRTP